MPGRLELLFALWGVCSYSRVGAVGGFHHYKVGSMFEGMLPTFGVKVAPDAFSRGFDIEKCELQYSELHDELYYAFKAFEFEDSSGVKRGLLRFANVLRGLGSAAQRCKLDVVSNQLQEAGDDIATVISDEVSANISEGGLSEVMVNGNNLTQQLQKATRMWYKKEYTACGKEVAALVVALVGVGVVEADPHSGIRTMDDYRNKMQEYSDTVRQAEQRMREGVS